MAKEDTPLQRALGGKPAPPPPPKALPKSADNGAAGPPARTSADHAAAGASLKATEAQYRAKYVPPPSEGDLFPIEMPFILLSGPPGGGKTLAAVLADPEQTLFIDTEKSAASYHKRFRVKQYVDLPVYTQKLNPGKEVTHESLFFAMKDAVKKTSPGVFRTLVIDTANKLEEGIASHVTANWKQYRLPTGEVQNINPLFWSAVKNQWDIVLVDALSRFRQVIVCTHWKEENRGGKGTGRMIPGGKDTLLKLAGAVFILERPVPVGKKQPVEKPVARLFKGRFVLDTTNPQTGEVIPRQVVPPRIADFTFGKLRWYMQFPPDFDRLSPDEEIPEERLSDADRLFLERQIAEAHAEAERLRRQRIDEATRKSSSPRERPPADRPGPAHDEEEGASRSPAPQAPGGFDPHAFASDGALCLLAELREEAEKNGMTAEQWDGFLKKNGLTRQALDRAKAGIVKSMTHYLASKLDLMDWHNTLYGEEEEEAEDGSEESE
jgi:DNA polymerase III delta prime subunit